MARNQAQGSENKTLEKGRSFEEDLTRLEEIVAVLESGEKTLADNLKLYEEGIRLSRSCHKKLDEVEGKLQILTSAGAADNSADGSADNADNADNNADNADNDADIAGNKDNGTQGALGIHISDFEPEERG